MSEATTYLYTDKWGYEHHRPDKLTAEVNRVTAALNADAIRVETATKALQGSVPADYRRGGNCGVLSIAICAGVSFEKAWAACRMRKGSKGSTTAYQRRQALIALRVKIEERAISYRQRHTVRVFARDFTVPGATYMVGMDRHVVTIRDGIVIDQAGAKPAATHWTRNKRVISSWRIL